MRPTPVAAHQPRPTLRDRALVSPSVGEQALAERQQALAERQPTAQKMLLDAIKLRTEALGGVSTGARGVNGVIKAASSVQKANSGDQFHAASAAASAMEKLTPVLSRSAVGAAAGAVVLAYGDDQLTKQGRAIGAGLKKATDETLAQSERVHGALDATLGASQLAIVGRSMGKAVVATGGYVGRTLQKVAAFAPLVGKAEQLVAKVGATQVGRSLAFLNKWIPLLNVAWVVMAGKTALDVHHDPQASTRTKTLSLVALGASAAVFGAGVLLGPWAFAGITAASIGADLALAYSRKRDAQATA